MSKRSVSYIVHSIFWNLLAFLPLIIAICFNLSSFAWVPSGGEGGLYLSIPPFISNVQNTFIYNIFRDFLLDSNFGIFESLSNSTFLPTFLTWFTIIEFFHIFYDIILFIPKWVHKFLNRKVIK